MVHFLSILISLSACAYAVPSADIETQLENHLYTPSRPFGKTSTKYLYGLAFLHLLTLIPCVTTDSSSDWFDLMKVSDVNIKGAFARIAKQGWKSDYLSKKRGTNPSLCSAYLRYIDIIKDPDLTPAQLEELATLLKSHEIDGMFLFLPVEDSKTNEILERYAMAFFAAVRKLKKRFGIDSTLPEISTASEFPSTHCDTQEGPASDTNWKTEDGFNSSNFH